MNEYWYFLIEGEVCPHTSSALFLTFSGSRFCWAILHSKPTYFSVTRPWFWASEFSEGPLFR